jgi:predicted O-linked N-acetylglucosamine transferase (SPINDLY family)
MGQFMDYMIVDKLSVPPDTLSEEISEFVSRTSRIVFQCFVFNALFSNALCQCAVFNAFSNAFSMFSFNALYL